MIITRKMLRQMYGTFSVAENCGDPLSNAQCLQRFGEICICRINVMLQFHPVKTHFTRISQNGFLLVISFLDNKLVVVVVAFSLHARIWGECSATHSPSVLFFFF